jgi:hypothetical protein
MIFAPFGDSLAIGPSRTGIFRKSRFTYIQLIAAGTAASADLVTMLLLFRGSKTPIPEGMLNISRWCKPPGIDKKVPSPGGAS